MKKYGFLAVTTSLAILLSACGNEVEKMQPLTLEEVAGQRLANLSQDEKDSMVYNFISDRILVDTNNLLKVPTSSLGAIESVITSARKTLKTGDSDKLTEEYANYLLMNFARTPYEWKQDKIIPVGYDASSRLYFVDVTYKTTKQMKKIIPKSELPNGKEDASAYKQIRYNEYSDYLNSLIAGDAELTKKKLDAFEKKWGSIASIKEEQQGVSILDRTSKQSNSASNIGRLTYSGLVSDSNLNAGGTMTVRYVLKYNYNLGEETDMGISSLYIKDYSVNNLENAEKSYVKNPDNLKNGTEVLKPFIDALITSYFKSVEESNHTGLNKIHYNYGKIDKYYDDLNKYAYSQTNGYSYTILDRSGTNLTIKVKTESQERAKGSGMSMPTYDQEYIFNLILDTDDQIKIDNVNLVKSTLVGEPISEIENVSGVSDLIQYSKDSFTDTNRKEVKETLKRFSKAVYEGKVDVKAFTDNVDIGVSQTTLNKMTANIVALQNNKKKTTYIQSWNTTNNTYASVTLREIFETSDQGTLDTEAVVDLINRDGQWKVVNYNRVLNVKTSGSLVSDKDALVVDK